MEETEINFENLGKELQKIFEEITTKSTLRDTRKLISKIFYDEKSSPTINRLELSYIAVVLATILMNKQNELSKFSNRPSLFLSNLLSRLFPISNANEKENEEYIKEISDKNSKIRKVFSTIDTSLWNNLTRNVLGEYVIFFWEIFNSGTEDKFSINNIIDRINKNDNKYDVFLKNEPNVSYGKYLDALEKELLKRQYYPDLVLIDTILLAEFRSKGTFDSIGHYLSQKFFEKYPYNDKESIEYFMGSLLNGTLEALPITRNFHLPGWYVEKKDESKGFLSKHDKYEEILEKGEKIEDLFELGERELNCLFENNKGETNDIFTGIFNNSKEGIVKERTHLGKTFVINMGRYKVGNDFYELPFIPLQGARDAHIAYAVFAYFGNIESHPLINVSSSSEGNSYEILMWNADAFKSIVENFLKQVYYYVPYCALCLDQEKAAFIRNKYYFHWFDPCLPIESEVFEFDSKYKIKFSKNAMKNKYEQPMSCIGGYCIALTHDSYQKNDAADLAQNITSAYYNEAKEAALHGQVPRFFNLRIAVDNYETIRSQNLDQDYYKVPDNVSKRPHFSGWRNLENIISDNFRRYMTVVMIHRSIVYELLTFGAQASNLENNEIVDSLLRKYNETSGIDQKILKESLMGKAPELYFIKEILNTISIKEHLSLIRNYLEKKFKSKGKEREINYWMKSHLGPIINESDFILSILKKATSNNIRVDPDINNRRNKFISKLAKDLSEVFYSNVENECANSGWTFKISK